MPQTLSHLLAGTGILSVFVRLTMAALFGAIIGIDRGRKRRPAGLRTYMLVCIGAALVMITGQFIAETHPSVDPTRLGAQVISGIGFLGAGTIIVTRNNQVIGLTTAAGLWASACIGLAIGIGFYAGAVVAEVFILLAMVLLHNLDAHFISRSKLVEVYAEFDTPQSLSAFLRMVRKHDLKISEMQFAEGREPTQGHIGALITVKSPIWQEHAEIIALLSAAEGLLYIEEI